MAVVDSEEQEVLSGGRVAEVHSVGEGSHCAGGSQHADDVTLVWVYCLYSSRNEMSKTRDLSLIHI